MTRLPLTLRLLLLQLLTMMLLPPQLQPRLHHLPQRLQLQMPLTLQTLSQLMRWRKFVSLVLHEGLMPPTQLL